MEALEAAFNEDESPWTRQSAVPRLSAVIQVLSLLSSPLEVDEYYSVIRTLEVVYDRLWAPGCSTNSEAIRHIGKSMGVLSPIYGQPPFPCALDKRIKASKVLLDAILLLSTSSSSTPLPRLPLDILYLILPYLATDPDFPTRRKTLLSLISTSTQWRKIALPTWNSQVILCSEVDASMWCDSYHYKTLESSSLDLLHIDLSTAKSAEIEALMRSPMRDGLKERGIKVKHITLNMEVDEDEMSSTENRDWYCFAHLFVVNNAVDWTLRMPAYSSKQYREAMLMFGEIPWDYEGRQELYLGSSPIVLTTRIVRYRLEIMNELFGFEDFLPLFTSYSVLSTPFLPFTVPLFLLDIFPTKPSLRPSRLEHLELSLEFDPSDPTEALR